MYVLEYMRTDVQVAGQEVLAFVLGDVEPSLEFPIHQIRKAIWKGAFGHKGIAKDFLLPKCTDAVVHRAENSKRRKCDTVVLTKHDVDTVTQLKAGKYGIS